MTLRLLTYNIHSGVGLDGVLDLGRIADVIDSAGADVVALQEVDRFRREQSRFEDQPGVLAQRLGMHLAYAANLDEEPAHPGAPRAQYGTALLSRLPFESSTNTLLPCFDGSEQRGLLEAVVVSEGVTLRVLGTHLQWDSETERTRQAEAIVATLDDRPTVLLGDLNTTPGSSAYRCLEGRLADAWTLRRARARGTPSTPSRRRGGSTTCGSAGEWRRSRRRCCRRWRPTTAPCSWRSASPADPEVLGATPSQSQVAHKQVSRRWSRPVHLRTTRRTIMRTSFLYRLGHGAAAHPWRTIGAWVLLVLVVGGLAATVGGTPQDDYNVPGARSQVGIDQLRAHLPGAGNTAARVVVHDRSGGRPSDASLADLTARLQAMPHVVQVFPAERPPTATPRSSTSATTHPSRTPT